MEQYPVLAANIPDFFEEHKYILDKVQFEYLKGKYSGRGVLTWHPDRGFHLQSFVTRDGSPLPSESFGGFRMIHKSDRKKIRMRPQKYRGWLIAPNVNLFERWDIRFEERLDVNISSVLFSSPNEQNRGSYTGSSLYYGIGKNIVLPDNVKEESILGNFHRVQNTMKGIILDEPKYQIVRGQQIREKYLWLHWSLDESKWKRSHSWLWPQAAADALSLLTGSFIQLICREVNRGSRTQVEMRCPREITHLSILSPLSVSYPLNKTRFARLVEFFTINSTEAKVCRHIFNQLLEADGQESWQACELLLSSILEAALRTLHDKPSRPGKRKGRRIDIKQHLQKFCKDYADPLIPFCDKANEVWKHLRHQNAHPDWLYFKRDPLSDERRTKSLEDMIFLARFYGYMILALSGEKGLEPEFQKKPFR